MSVILTNHVEVTEQLGQVCDRNEALIRWIKAGED